jgi:hypothetical protein
MSLEKEWFCCGLLAVLAGNSLAAGTRGMAQAGVCSVLLGGDIFIEFYYG